jgi:hypothetical protein
MIEAIKRDREGRICTVQIYESMGIKGDFCTVYPKDLEIVRHYQYPGKKKFLPPGCAIAEIKITKYPTKIMVRWLSHKIFNRRCHCYVLTVTEDEYKNQFLGDFCPFCRSLEGKESTGGDRVQPASGR